MHSGMVFDIQRCCVHDGPGIRTTVFLKGCPLRCFWCHNPESLRPERQLMFFSEKCIQCGQCAEVCVRKAHTMENGVHVFDRTRCIGCGQCAEQCDTRALSIAGKTMTSAQVEAEVLKDMPFYQTSGGGVTFSGGEPLLQIDFLEEVLKLCKQHNIHTAVETAGNVNRESFQRIAPYTDLFLYDVKVMDSEKHREVVGADNTRCLANLKELLAEKRNVRVRIPVIPGVNDSEECIGEIAEFVAAQNKNVEIELMPFHKMGQSKYESLGLAYKAEGLEPPSDEKIEGLKTILKEKMKEK